MRSKSTSALSGHLLRSLQLETRSIPGWNDVTFLDSYRDDGHKARYLERLGIPILDFVY